MLEENEGMGQRYHHGNVKESLVDVAMRLIRDNQVELISLRRLAKEVGVTPSAVYNHFSDKNELMLAIKIRIYEEFNHFFEQRFSNIEQPEEALIEACLAYYHFSKEHPSHYHFLFSSTLPLEWSTPETAEIFCRVLVRTRKIIFSIYEKNQIPCTEAQVVRSTLLTWSQLHGIIMLRNSGSIAAAVEYQDWPQECALIQDSEIEDLIRGRIQPMIDLICTSAASQVPH